MLPFQDGRKGLGGILIRSMLTAKDPSQRPTMIEVNRRLQSIGHTGVSERRSQLRLDAEGEDKADSLDNTKTSTELVEPAPLDSKQIERRLSDTPLGRTASTPTTEGKRWSRRTLLMLAASVVALGMVVGRVYMSSHSPSVALVAPPPAAPPPVPSSSVLPSSGSVAPTTQSAIGATPASPAESPAAWGGLVVGRVYMGSHSPSVALVAAPGCPATGFHRRACFHRRDRLRRQRSLRSERLLPRPLSRRPLSQSTQTKTRSPSSVPRKPRWPREMPSSP